MANIESSNVKKVFPSSLRVYDGAKSKFTSEDNLTGIVRVVVKPSYILSHSNTLWELVINGYYFKLEKDLS